MERAAPPVTASGLEGRRTLLALGAVTSLFFAWGFITSNNDPLLVTLRAAFGLNYKEALLTQIVSFVANGLLSLPAAWLMSRWGAVDTILGSLGLMALGCIAVVASTGIGAFPPILGALFIIAAGFTGLQVAANPLAAELGPRPRSHFRLNFAQAFNSLGVVLGVHFGSRLMLGDPSLRSDAARTLDHASILQAVDRAFLIMAGLIIFLLLVFVLLRRFLIRALPGGNRRAPSGILDALRSRWAQFGALAIGLYVGAEVSIGSIMINFLNQPRVLGLPLEAAGMYLANFYWGGALVGRIAGTLLLTRVSAPRLLLSCASIASLLCATVVASHGPVSAIAALAVGLFNSIMFPTIFSITLERSGVAQSATSGLLGVAVFGGALLPLAVGAVADRIGLGMAFAVPLISYVVIAAFAFAARDPGRKVPS